MATYTGFVVWQCKMKHTKMKTIAHGMEILFGRPGRVVAEITQDLMLLFVMVYHPDGPKMSEMIANVAVRDVLGSAHRHLLRGVERAFRSRDVHDGVHGCGDGH